MTVQTQANLFFFIFIALYLIAWILTMQIVTKAAREKGYQITGRLWFIGFFGLIFTPAIIVAALPDKKPQQTASETSETAPQASQIDNLPNV